MYLIMMKDFLKEKEYDMILVDAMNLCARSYHGIKTEFEGTPTGMIYGVMRFVVTAKKVYGRAKVVFLWEGGQSRRKVKHPEYKANREGRVYDESFNHQIRDVKSDIKWSGHTQMCCPGVEADDLAGWMVDRYPDKNILLVSNDEDWYQFMRRGRVDIMRRDSVELYEDVEMRLGYPPERIALYKILTGDASDNIKGLLRFPHNVAILLVKGCDDWKKFDKYELLSGNPKLTKWEELLKSERATLEKNADMILYHPEWIGKGAGIEITLGRKRPVELKTMLLKYGMVKTVEALEL